MQPEFYEPLNVPQGINPENAITKTAYKVPPLINRWKYGIYYGEYGYNSLKAYATA